MSFENIYGNANIKKLLYKTVKSNSILHSYLFVGPEGIGKMLFAKEFAKMLLCFEEDLSKRPCDTCKSCTEFVGSNHPDFLIIKSEDNKSIKIEQVRYLQEKIAEKPIVSNHKVYIIEDADLMTKEAQNCLLKTLEEPPSYSTIILTASNESKLLNTIRSRCSKIAFHGLSNSDIISYFADQGDTTQFSENILQVCCGSIGRAIKLKENAESYSKIDSMIAALSTEDIIDLWNNSEILYKSKENIFDLLDYMNVVLINALMKTQKTEYITAIDTVELTKTRLASNANYDMSIDNLLLVLWEEFHEKYCRG